MTLARTHGVFWATIAVFGIASAPRPLRGAWEVPTAPDSAPAPLPTCADLTAMALHDAGLSPAALTAAAASDQQVEQIVLVARARCEANSTEYTTLWSSLAETRARVQALQSKARRHGATQQERGQLAEAREQLAALEGARAAAIDDIRGIVNQVLPEDRRLLLWAVCDAKAVDAPTAFKVVSRTEAQWMTLRDQLAEEGTRARRGQEGGSTVSRESDVEVAAYLLETRLAEVARVWNRALRE